jgi:aminoglycoside 6-adenylyltransferase
MQSEKAVIENLLNWANNNDIVRTVILTSSRVRDEANIDFLSDYDIELYVSDLSKFIKSDEWLENFGQVMVRWPFKPKSTFSDEWITRLVLFNDGVRIDFQICSLATVDSDRYDNGYKVLLDKDNITSELKKPTYTEFIIKKPTEEEYQVLVHEFWWDAYYVSKYLWRDELPFAKFMLDYILRYSFIHKIVDWYIGSENNWSVETGALGKKYKKMLPAQLWKEFQESYAGGSIEENWEALFKIAELFRKIAKDIGVKLGYSYPDNVDREVMDFILKIKNTRK